MIQINLPLELARKYSKKQLDFICHYLKNGNIKQSAKLSGVSEATIYNWFRDLDLENDLTIIRAEHISGNLNRLGVSVSKAIDVLVNIMDDIDCPRSIRLNAAKITLENVLKLREQNSIIDRITDLENKMEKR